MPFNINDFRAALRGDGARPSQFQVNLAAPPFVALNTRQLSFMASATQLPGSQIGQIAVPYFGRVIKVAGDRQISDWTIDVINDESFDLFAAFERWINAMGHTSTRLNAQRVLGATSSPSSYVGQGIVQQLGKEDKVLRTYKMTNVFPTSVSPISLSWGAIDQLETFSVTFSMDWFEVVEVQNPGAN